MKKTREQEGQTEFEVEPTAGRALPPSPPEEEQYEPDLTKLPAEERKKEARRLFVTSKHSLQELSVMFAISERTLQDWAKKEAWRDEQNQIEIMTSKLKDSLKWLLDPTTEEGALAEGNLKVLLEIQGIHLAHMKYSMLTGDNSLATIFPSGMADAIQKYAGALEKLNKTSTNMKNGGVSKSEVTHKHEIDMDKALQLAMQLKKETGKVITVTEAAKILDDQVKGRSEKTDVKPAVSTSTSEPKKAAKVMEAEVIPAKSEPALKSESTSAKTDIRDIVSDISEPARKVNLGRFNIAKKK